MTTTPGASDSTPLYDASTSEGFVVKFILPVIVGSLGLIEFFLLASVLIYVCTKLAVVSNRT